MRSRTVMSPFADALRGLLDDTQVFNRREWAKLLGIREAAISQWLSEETIPRASNLNLIFVTIERASDAEKGPLDVFRQMAELPALEASPKNGKRMLPTVWSYMKRPVFDELSNQLARLSPADQERLLEEKFLSNIRLKPASQPAVPTPTAAGVATSRDAPHPAQPVVVRANIPDGFGKSATLESRALTQPTISSPRGLGNASVDFIVPTFRQLSNDDSDKPVSAPVSLEQLGSQSAHFVLMGGPGTGKSSVVQFLAEALRDKASAVSRSWNGRQPLFVQLHRLPAVCSISDLWEALPKSGPVELDRTLLLFDGFDEVLLERRDGLVRAISELRSADLKTAMIITSRPTPDLRSLFPIPHYRLELPTESRLLAFACNRVPMNHQWDDGFLRVNAYFRGKPDVFRALGTPLLLSYAASLFASSRLPSREGELIGSCLKYLVERWDEDKDVVRSRSDWTDPRSQLLYHWLGRICYHSLLHQSHRFTGHQLADWCGPPSRSPMEADLKAIAEATGVLVPSGDTHWTIAHKTICEYLAARFIVESSEDAARYLEVGAGSTWMADVLRLASSITHDASSLLSFVLRRSWSSRTEKMSVLAGVLAQQAGASKDVLDQSCNVLVELLEQSFANWRVVTSEEESEVFPEPKWRLAARTEQPPKSEDTGMRKHLRQTVQAIHQSRLAPIEQQLSNRLAQSSNEVVRGIHGALNIEGYMEGRSFSRDESELFAAEICEI